MDAGVIVEEGKPDQLLFAPRTERVRASSSATTIAIGSDQPRRESELLDARLQFLLQSGLAKSPCCGFATRILAGVGHGSTPAFS